ncbi:MAG TPA: hypothetical protein VKD25_09290 [Burkholderiales bacterium]|nr:hypothetical protein [Burkholderiales bacterium]
MKRIVLAAIIAALPSATVYGQAPQGDKPAVVPPAPAMKEEAKPAAPQKEVAAPQKEMAAPQKEITVVQGPGQSAVKEDARHCLEHGDNTDIIKCAEPYLPAKRK